MRPKIKIHKPSFYRYQDQDLEHPEQSLLLYEQRKQAWIRMNPEATPKEYEAAIERIAREAGV